MKICVLHFTDRGKMLAEKLESLFEAQWIFRERGESGPQFIASHMGEADAFLFIGAVGIAARMMAPFIRSKDIDPAVVVIDEMGSYSIPLLSGHLGGANGLARALALPLGAQPVITTATDLNQVFAVDVWSKKIGAVIRDISKIKEVSSALLRGKTVGLTSDFPICGELPGGIAIGKEYPVGIAVSMREEGEWYPSTLQVVPRLVTIGVGCRKNTPVEQFEEFLLDVLRKENLALASVEAVASISLKAEEACICDFCSKYQIPYRTYTAQELSKLEGDFSASPFVAETVGVDNVCERSAAAQGAELLMRKRAEKGMTAALAVKKWRCEF